MTDYFVKLNGDWARVPTLKDVALLFAYGRTVKLGC